MIHIARQSMAKMRNVFWLPLSHYHHHTCSPLPQPLLTITPVFLAAARRQQQGGPVAHRSLIQQRTSRPDSRRAAQDVLQWDTPLEDSAYKTRLEDGKEQVLSNDSTKAGQTEERGCSPITVLEARPEVDHVATRPRSRAGSHTITTTTSWGAPVTTTTSIEVDDDQSARCVQLTLHSESRVTLHAPGGVWEGLHGVEQQPEHQDEEQQPHEDKHVGDNDVPAEASPDAGPENKSEGETLTEQDFYDDIHQAKDAHELESKETECAIPALSGDDSAYLASEATAPSAHRPTTLMITSNSNESTDDAECTANDLTKLGREDDIPKELKEETSVTEMEDLEEQGMGELAVSERPPGSESGAVPRPERPARPAPRTTTLVKVKVEKRPITSHLLVRERSVHEHQPTVHVPSVEEEVRGLMQEVKEATSQIKQEVKELRQADTPTPDTPTPLREFKEFLNREEEQELERLPTIKEMCRESEEDASGTVGGEHLRGHEHLRLDLDVPTLGRPIPVQAVQRSGDDSSHPDSGYSTLEGYYAVGVDPYHTSKYKSCSEPVPEGSPSEPSIKSELESPSSLVDSSDLSPVDSASATEEKGRRFHAENLSSGNITSLAVNMPVGTQMETTTLGVPGGQSPIGEMNGQDIQDALTDVEDLNMDGESPIPKQKQLLLLPEKETGAVTDTEDMDLSGDENDIIPEKANLPTIQDLGVLPEPTKEVINLTEGYAREASPLLLSDSDSEREDVQNRHKKNIKKGEKMSELEVPGDDEPEGVTDVEDMVASGDEIEEQVQVEDSLPDHYLDQGEGVSNQEKMKAASPKPKVFKHHEDSSDDEKRSKKQVRRRSKASLTVQPKEDGVAMYDTGAITDSEDVAASDTEDIADIVAAPLKKKESSIIPEPHAEKIRISETEEAPAKDSEGETDEEGFQLDDNEDEKPLVPRKRVVSEPIEKVVKEALEVEEPCEAALTDTEDFDLEDKEEEEVISDIASRIPTEGEIYTIKELESEYGQVTKKEIVKDADAELKELIREAEAGGLTLQEALNCEALTDVEDLDDDEPGKPKPKIAPSKKVQKDETATDEESVDESDIEEEIRKPPKRTRHRGKRLPLVPQVSEVRFVETDQGPLSIIITPDNLDNNPDQVVKDKVTGVVFLESEEKEEATTDVEELQSSDDEGQKRRASILNAPQLTTEPATDTEDFDVDAVEVDRPLSPLPPDLNYNVLSSPKREIIHIKEDKYGVPQVTIRKLQKDELLVSDVEDMAMTDTEDIEVSDAEALRLVGATTDSTAEFELPDTGKIEVSSTMKQKNQALHVDADEEGGSTDVEELQMTKKIQTQG
ncbi:hypothetical protein C7M84_009640 [Penaeus vannamei]|uniref:Uncharacterized protein n=1 Tax=Penaeus vannamei TaxID=6689 RepID=A0A3R7PHJ8_PENVA|nr:hypothetical protein C7M84_009640 [Penaeus vannamei]